MLSIVVSTCGFFLATFDWSTDGTVATLKSQGYLYVSGTPGILSEGSVLSVRSAGSSFVNDTVRCSLSLYFPI